jgi:4-amino-4-deoxy-L-arabinose transferase-like glycosyltransferase
MRYNVADIVHYTALDVHPPLYYLVLKAWSLVFGTSALALRSFSVVLSTFSLIGVYFLVKRLSSPRRAVLGALLFALMPTVVLHGVEARMYPLVMLIAVASTYVMLLAKESLTKVPPLSGAQASAADASESDAEGPREDAVADASESAGDATSPKNAPRNASEPTSAPLNRTVLPHLGYALLIAVGVWTQYFTALLFVAQFIWYIYAIREKRIKQWVQNCRFLLLSGVVSVLLFAPWVPALLAQLKSVNDGFWIPRADVSGPVSVFSEVLLFDPAAWVYNWRILLFWSVVGLYVYALAKRTSANLAAQKLILFLGLIPMVLLYAISLHEPFFIARYLFAPMVILALGIPVLLRATRSTALLTVLIACAFITGQMVFLERGFPSHTQGFDVATAAIEHQSDVENGCQKVVSSEQNSFYTLAQFEDSDLQVFYFLDDLSYSSSEMEKDNLSARLDPSDLTPGEILWNIDDSDARGYINEHPEKFELVSEERFDGYDARLRKYRVR